MSHVRCPNGHRLTRFRPGRSGFSCDGCRRRANPNDTLYGCRPCNFDYCSSCNQMKQQFAEMKVELDQNRRNYNNHIQRQQQQQQRLQNEMSNLLKRNREQRRQFEQNQKQIESSLQTKINQLEHQKKTEQKRFENKLRDINHLNDTKIKNLEQNRLRDRKEHEIKLQEIQYNHREKMKQIEINEMKHGLLEKQQLINLQLQQYKDKKISTTNIFKQYIEELTQIKLEERRLSHFKNEINDKELLNVVLIGPTGHGKSALACRLTGDESMHCDEGHFYHNDDPESVTQHIQKQICRNKWKKKVSVIDAPGILDSNGNDREHANNLIEFLRGCGGVNAFILVKTRIPPRFDQSFQNVLKSLEKLLGRSFWRHVIIAITHTSGKDAVPISFNKYAQKLKALIYKEMKLDPQEATLECVGLDSFTNYKRPIKQLINIVPTKRFNCNTLQSPLQALKLQNKQTEQMFNGMRCELDAITAMIMHYNQELNEGQQKLKRYDAQFTMSENVQLMKFISSTKSNSNEWSINIKLPPPQQPKYNHYDTSNMNDDEKHDKKVLDKALHQNQKQQKSNGHWMKYKAANCYNLIGELDDDQVTLKNLEHEDSGDAISWPLRLNAESECYNEYLDIFEKADDDGDDVRIGVVELYYRDCKNLQNTKMEREILFVAIKEDE